MILNFTMIASVKHPKIAAIAVCVMLNMASARAAEQTETPPVQDETPAAAPAAEPEATPAPAESAPERPAPETPPAPEAPPPVLVEAAAPVPEIPVPTEVPPPEVKPVAPEEPMAVDVTVVGTKVTRTAGSAHVLKAKEMERMDYDDPHAVLASVPGLYTRGEDGIGLRPNIGLRGVNSDRSKKVTLMEDGVLFGPAPYSAPAAYYFPLTTRMNQVRVIKGPGSISYGPQTVGGAIDYVTRLVPSFTSGAIDMAGGQYGYRKLHAHFGANDGKTGYVIEGITLGNDGFKKLDSGGDVGMDRRDIMWKGYYRFEPIGDIKNRVELKLSYGDEESHETYLGLSDVDFRANPLRRYDASAQDLMKWHRTASVLTHVIEFSPKLSVTTNAYRHDLSRSWRKFNGFAGASAFNVLANPNDPTSPLNAVYNELLNGRVDSSNAAERILIGPNQRDFVSQGIQSVLRYDVETGPVSHRIEAGARLHYDRIERRHTEDTYLLQAGKPIAAGTPTALLALNEASTVAGAFHLSDAITYKETTLTPGLRVETIHSRFEDQMKGTFTERSVNVVMPGVGIYQGILPGLGLLAGVHRGFSPPPPGSGSSVRSESSINYEGGFRFARGRFHTETIGFFNDYTNLTDVCTLSSGCLDINLDRQYDAGKAKIWGVEEFLRYEARLGAFTVPLQLAYTYTRTRFGQTFNSEDPLFGNVLKGDEMPYVPRHTFNLGLGLEHTRGGFNTSVNHISAMRELAGSEDLSKVLATDALTVIDTSAYVRIKGPFVLYANLRNLLNEQVIVSRRPFGARPNPPRWFQVGIRASF